MSHWIAPVVVLAAGALVGLGWLIFMRRAFSAPSPEAPAALLDARHRLGLFLEQLRELEEDRKRLDPAHYAAERARLEKLAAGAMRARDEAAKVAPAVAATAAAPAPAGLLAARPELRGALWGGGVVAFLALLGLLLYFNAAPRVGDAPMTGTTPGGVDAAFPPRPIDEVLANVMDLYDPDTVAAHAHRALVDNRREDARKLTDRALRLDPMHFEARIHHAALQGLSGEEKEALSALERILRERREPEALLFRGVIAARAGDRKLAADALEELRRLTPDGEAAKELEKLVASLRRR